MNLDAPVVQRLFNIHEEIARLTALTPKSQETRLLKLTSEVGELANAVDIAAGNAGTSYRTDTDALDPLEEAVDVVLVIASFIVQFTKDFNVPLEVVLDIVEQKMAKWERVINLPANTTPQKEYNGQ